MVVTVPERKARAIQRLEAAAAAAKAALCAYARAHDGRFVLFGSLARGDIRGDSDIDIMVDFDERRERAAREAAEAICRQRGLVPDVHLRSEVSAALMQRVRRDGVDLS